MRKNILEVIMEGFTVALALVDAIPVVAFGAAMLTVAAKFGSPVFIVGAALSTLAGCLKVAWKLILGLWKKDLRWLNKPFVPMQASGFLLMLLSFALDFGKISWPGVLAAVTGFPALLFFLLWFGFMGTMVWYRKNRFDHDNARSNWIAQFINCAGQLCLLLAVLLAG